MRTRSIEITCVFFIWVAAMLIGTVGCGGSDHEGPVGTDRMEQGTIHPDGTTEADASAGTDDGGQTAGDAEARRDRAGTAEDDAGTEGLAADRRAALENVRSTTEELEEELAQVRERLRDGTSERDDRRADRSRAAEIAQSLERLQQYENDIRDASDEEWAGIQQELQQELQEVRAQMNAQRENEG